MDDVHRDPLQSRPASLARKSNPSITQQSTCSNQFKASFARLLLSTKLRQTTMPC